MMREGLQLLTEQEQMKFKSSLKKWKKAKKLRSLLGYGERLAAIAPLINRKKNVFHTIRQEQMVLTTLLINQFWQALPVLCCKKSRQPITAPKRSMTFNCYAKAGQMHSTRNNLKERNSHQRHHFSQKWERYLLVQMYLTLQPSRITSSR